MDEYMHEILEKRRLEAIALAEAEASADEFTAGVEENDEE